MQTEKGGTSGILTRLFRLVGFVGSSDARFIDSGGRNESSTETAYPPGR